jgi:hypothetical protein
VRPAQGRVAKGYQAPDGRNAIRGNISKGRQKYKNQRNWLDQFDHTPLSVYIAFDIALGS